MFFIFAAAPIIAFLVVFVSILLPYFRARMPSRGSFKCYKQVGTGYYGRAIATLEVPAEAKRYQESVLSGPHAGKFRVSEAKVLSIKDYFGKDVTEAYSLWDHTFDYKVGATVKPRREFEDSFHGQCASGIHAFMTYSAAKNMPR